MMPLPSSSWNSLLWKSSLLLQPRRGRTLTHIHILEKETNVICAHHCRAVNKHLRTQSPDHLVRGHYWIPLGHQGSWSSESSDLPKDSRPERGESRDSDPGFCPTPKLVFLTPHCTAAPAGVQMIQLLGMLYLVPTQTYMHTRTPVGPIRHMMERQSWAAFKPLGCTGKAFSLLLSL